MWRKLFGNKEHKLEYARADEAAMANPVYSLIINEDELSNILKIGRLFPPWLVGPVRYKTGDEYGRIIFENASYVFSILGPKEFLSEAEKWEKTEPEKSGYHVKALIEITPQFVEEIRSGAIYKAPQMYGATMGDAVFTDFTVLILGLKLYNELLFRARSISDGKKFLGIKGAIRDLTWNEVDLIVAYDSLPTIGAQKT